MASNLSWPEARALALTGRQVRRVGWVDHWLIYDTCLWWILKYNPVTKITSAPTVVLASDWTTAEFTAKDWTTDDVSTVGTGSGSSTGSGGSSTPVDTKLNFSVLMDGSDFLHIKGNQLWLAHRNYKFPTAMKVGGIAWNPAWTYVTSSYVTNPQFTLTFNADGNTLSAMAFTGRLSVTVTQYPSAANGWETILLLNDDNAGGQSAYSVDLTFTR